MTDNDAKLGEFLGALKDDLLTTKTSVDAGEISEEHGTLSSLMKVIIALQEVDPEFSTSGALELLDRLHNHLIDLDPARSRTGGRPPFLKADTDLRAGLLACVDWLKNKGVSASDARAHVVKSFNKHPRCKSLKESRLSANTLENWANVWLPNQKRHDDLKRSGAVPVAVSDVYQAIVETLERFAVEETAEGEEARYTDIVDSVIDTLCNRPAIKKV